MVPLNLHQSAFPKLVGQDLGLWNCQTLISTNCFFLTQPSKVGSWSLKAWREKLLAIAQGEGYGYHEANSWLDTCCNHPKGPPIPGNQTSQWVQNPFCIWHPDFAGPCACRTNGAGEPTSCQRLAGRSSVGNPGNPLLDHKGFRVWIKLKQLTMQILLIQMVTGTQKQRVKVSMLLDIIPCTSNIIQSHVEQCRLQMLTDHTTFLYFATAIWMNMQWIAIEVETQFGVAALSLDSISFHPWGKS